LGFGGGLLPHLGRGSNVEGLDGKQGHEGCFIAGKEFRQDAEQQVRGRRALRKKVEPVGERLVAIS
jgi:hypothetical protein